MSSDPLSANGRAEVPLRLHTLGATRLDAHPADGEPSTILGPGKPLALLVYLAFSPGRSASREHLIDLLWSDLEPERGKHALRQTIYFLRHLLGERALVGAHGELTLALPLHADRDAFLEATEEGDLDATVALYAGPFLPGFVSPGGAEFEHWADLERERLRGIFLRSAETLARRRLGTLNFREAQRLARRVRDEDPLDESAWRLLIETLVSAQDQLAAAIEADALTSLLQAEGREPEPATRASLRLARQRPTADEAPARSGPGTGLVAELVGREREFGRIIRAWEEARGSTARHVHISGPAGFGKTRLLGDVHGRLRATGARAVSLRATPGDRRIGYALAGELARLTAGLPGAAAVSPAAASALVALHPALSAQYAAAIDQSTGDEALRRRTMAVSELIAAVADEAPLALLVDDLHWADPASQQLLLGLIARLDRAPVLVVTTARPTREPLAETPTSERLALEPLVPGQVEALLASLGALPREAWAHSLVHALHETTGGSPLLIIETLQLAIDRGSLALGPTGWTCRDPVFLVTELQAGGALRHRFSQLGDGERYLLLLLGTAGAPLPHDQLARAAGRSAEDLDAALAALERRGFVLRSGSEWEPSHDQIAELAVEVAGPAARRGAHLVLGRVIAADASADGLHLPRAAYHLAAAGADEELRHVFGRWVRIAEGRGDLRPLPALAAELLGEHGTHERIESLRRGAPWRARLRAGELFPVRAAAMIVAVGAIVGVAAMHLFASVPPDAILFGAWAGQAEKAVLVAMPVDREILAQERPLDLAAERAELELPEWSSLVGRPQPSPDGRRAVHTRTVGDSGVVDLFLHLGNGRERRLTHAPREDTEPGWAPDGRMVVFSTRRWAAPGTHDADIALVDPDRGGVVRLTGGPGADHHPRWSPDGTRIGFVRRHGAPTPAQLCWTTPAAQLERCVTPEGYELLETLGWLDGNQMLALADSVDHQTLVIVDVDHGRTRGTESGAVLDAALSPDGRWVACLCQRGGEPPAWYVADPHNPEPARQVVRGTREAPFTLFWGPPGRLPTYLAQVRIAGPAERIPVDATFRLSVRGSDPLGEMIPVPPATLVWSSADTTVARVDRSTGVVYPRRQGRVLVTVTAGGWRRDSAELVIGAPGSQGRLEERWEALDSATWYVEGRPLLRTERDPAGAGTLVLAVPRVAADGVYGDMVTSLTSQAGYSAQHGIGVEARVASPTTGPRRQRFLIALAPPDSVGVGGVRDPLADPRSCVLAYPGGSGPGAVSRFVLSVGGMQKRLPADEGVAAGDWYTVRLQLFQDGTCGVAVNGVALERSHARISTAAPLHLRLEGGSTDTQLRIGAVALWEGLKGDVDWSGVDGR
jgi:DNA-binding SARP family transcriptional activator